jgi:hypothetical protein
MNMVFKTCEPSKRKTGVSPHFESTPKRIPVGGVPFQAACALMGAVAACERLMCESTRQRACLRWQYLTRLSPYNNSCKQRLVKRAQHRPRCRRGAQPASLTSSGAARGPHGMEAPTRHGSARLHTQQPKHIIFARFSTLSPTHARADPAREGWLARRVPTHVGENASSRTTTRARRVVRVAVGAVHPPYRQPLVRWKNCPHSRQAAPGFFCADKLP